MSMTGRDLYEKMKLEQARRVFVPFSTGCVIRERNHMRHVFRAQKLGWEKEKEGIWFDADEYTEEEAKAQFEEYEGTTQRGDSYAGYEYGGDKFYRVTYLGLYEDDEMPRNDAEWWQSLLKKDN
ncbi:hypothetical protein ACXZ66_06575 [Corynebacterium sp. S7]